MAEDFDVEAMLEAPYNSNKDPPTSLNGTSNHEKGRGDVDRERKRHRSRSPSLIKGRDRDRDRERGRDRDRDRPDRDSKKLSRSKERRRSGSRGRIRRRSRSTSRGRRPRSRSHEKRRRSKSRDRFRRRSPIRWGDRWGGGRKERFDRSRSRSPHRREDLPAEERDQRTVFCMQLAAKVRPRDLEEFFSAVGKVREVRLIIDAKTRRHKGIAYIEFYEISSVSLALALNGQKLCGYPISIQPTQAEKNRAAAAAAAAAAASTTTTQKGVSGPMRLYVGSLHFNITEDMLKGIFEPFGRIEKIELQRDPETLRSKGYGFITFYDAEDAKKALEQLNGFELAGRQMKVNHVTERSDIIVQGPSILDSDELDRTGIDLGTTGRLQLMAKLAEGTGIELPPAAVTALQSHKVTTAASTAASANSNSTHAPAIATQCFTLTNMFDPTSETNPNWEEEIRNDVIEECRKHGGALHVYVDRNSQGNVYVKCPSIASSTACVNALHGRWFSGRVVTAAYVPVINYHNLFSDSVAATTPL